MNKTLSCLCVLPAAAFTLDTKPWLGNVYEFVWDTAFTYSRYRKVENASRQLRSVSNDYDLLFDLSGTFSPQIDLQAELELAETPRQLFNVRSAAIQGRFQWLDDISGDPFSLTLGFNLRAVPGHALRDVSCPYAANCNYELSCSVGKEWSTQGLWTMRTYGWLSLGAGNHGLPWSRQLLVWQNNWSNTHRLSFFTCADFGFGTEQGVDVRHFHGWGKFHHQSIDAGLAYGYHCASYGTLSLAYTYRLFARNFPERVNFFTLAYTLPFSIF
jgi:hypothetical protein